MKKPWYHAPKDADGWPLWVPWLEAEDFRRNDLADWIYRVYDEYPARICRQLTALCGSRIGAYGWSHSNADQAAVWNRLCREIGYTEEHDVRV